MDKHFMLNIVTPSRTVYSGEVESFTAPGVVGSFQVLFNHAPLLSEIGIGEVKVKGTDGALTRYATAGGFVEVKGNTVVLLAESAEAAVQIDVARAERSKQRAEERLRAKEAGTDVARAEASLLRSINRLKIASMK